MNGLRYLTEVQAAEYLGLSPKTLSRWRWAKRGPSFTKLGGSVRYILEELDAFAAAGAVRREGSSHA